MASSLPALRTPLSRLVARPAALGTTVAGLGLLVAAEIGLGFAVNDAKVLLLAVAGLGGLGLVLATLARPEACVLVLLFVLSTSLSDIYGPADGLVSVNQLLVALFLLALVVNRLNGRRRALVVDRTFGWLMALGAAMALSSIGAQNPAAATPPFLEYLREMLIVFVMVNLVNTLPSVRAATWTLVAAGVLLASAAMLYLTTGFDLGGLGGAEIAQIAGSQQGSRLTGPTQDSNIFAQMLVPLVPLALYRAWDERQLALRVAALAAVGLLSVVIVLTFSRGAMIALVGVAALAMIMQRARPRRGLVLALVLGAVALAAPPSYWDRITGTVQFATGQDSELANSDGSARERSLLWRVGVQMFVDHPLTGVGFGNYLEAYPRYAWQIDPTLTAAPRVAHSLPVQVAAEMGVLGLATFAGVLVAAAAGLRSAKRRCLLAGLRREAMCLEGIELAMFGYFITSLFLSGTSRYTWLLIGLAIIGRQAASRSIRGALPARASLPDA